MSTLSKLFANMGYKRTSNRGCYGKENLQAALVSIADGQSIRSVANQSGIPRRTLQRHSKGQVKAPGEQHFGRFRPVFSAHFEQQLVDKLIDLQNRFHGLSLEEVREITYEVAVRSEIEHPFKECERKAGKGWMRGFLSRHPELSIRSPEPTSIARASGFNKPQVDKFFNQLSQILHEEGLQAGRIYNMDESGITTVHKPRRIIAKKGQKCVGKITSAERGNNVTVICCMSAGGNYCPPFIIFPRKKMNDRLMRDTPPGSVGAVSDSGWSDSQIFLSWLEHFIKNVKPSVNEKVLLLLDGHSSHKTLAAELARANGIILLCFPPHTTHKLQPLDVSFFFPLKQAYNSECDKWMLANAGQRITFFDMGGLFGKAYGRAATHANAVAGFRATGCWPWNPDVFSAEDFASSGMTDEEHALIAPNTGRGAYFILPHCARLTIIYSLYL